MTQVLGLQNYDRATRHAVGLVHASSAILKLNPQKSNYLQSAAQGRDGLVGVTNWLEQPILLELSTG
jgi:hypothetical protein